MSRQRYDGHVYYDRYGNMMSYPIGWSVPSDTPNADSYRDRYTSIEPEPVILPPFEATLRVVSYERGRSAMRFILQDVVTGIKYPMFLSDVFQYLEGAEIQRLWRPVKKGSDYGIQAVQ